MRFEEVEAARGRAGAAARAAQEAPTPRGLGRSQRALRGPVAASSRLYTRRVHEMKINTRCMPDIDGSLHRHRPSPAVSPLRLRGAWSVRASVLPVMMTGEAS